MIVIPVRLPCGSRRNDKHIIAPHHSFVGFLHYAEQDETELKHSPDNGWDLVECSAASPSAGSLLWSVPLRALISHHDMPGIGDVPDDQKHRILRGWIDIGNQALISEDM